MTPPFGEREVNGWRIRIDQGRKHADDRRIWVASPGGRYCLLSLAALGAITALWYRNEDVLYPPADGFYGGEFVLQFLAACCNGGLQKACAVHRLPDPDVRRIDPPDLEAAA